ncbi:acyltransferase [Hymenobacter sp. BT664]|uniref:Acyltransferase n=1 Tax=Hymenobacter montanus TaxID=2771359 RepID=A0A927BA87_9BACT|nr:acyltransferase [Hymenobacter montanus]MBD2766413.1 acyltransferase [Hymenobacter montanus]
MASDKTSVVQEHSVSAKASVSRIFFPNLDGLRFLAFFGVFLFHSFYTNSESIKSSLLYHIPYAITRVGYLGVNFFFVLSGFLITYLLLSERHVYGKIHVIAFYLRRILRIWPLYYVVVVLGFVLYPWLKQHFGEAGFHETAKAWYYVFFLGNFNSIYNGGATPTLELLWSVSIEEQFYLVWPLLVAAVPAPRMGWLFAGVLVLSIAFRLGNLYDHKVLDLHTFSVIGDMALGGGAAWLCFRDDRLTAWIAQMPRWMIGVGYLAGITLIYSQSALGNLPWYLAIERLVLGMFFAFVLLEQNYAKNSIIKMSKLRFPTYWGTYTYGLYCLHYLALLAAIQLLKRLDLNNSALGVVLGDNLVGLLLALVISWISFNYYEKLFLKLKNRFAFITRN